MPSKHPDDSVNTHNISSSPLERGEERIQSYREFWPYYLNEHRAPLCRHVHFIGTTGFMLYLGYSIYHTPLLGGVLILALGLGWLNFKREARANAFWVLFGMIGALCWAEPSIIYGILFAYFWAWVGHFLIEHNRPATFAYPLWSLASDFKMWGEMCFGRHWTGSAPIPSVVIDERSVS